MRISRPWVIGIAGALLANVVFFLVTIAAALSPPEFAAARAREAFASGALTEADWPGLNPAVGFNQYSDCNVFQMLLDNERNPFKRGLAPVIRYRDANWGNGLCSTMHAVLNNEPQVASFLAVPYTRYWHGYNASTAVLLHVVSFERIRQIMTVSLFAVLLLLPVIAILRTKRLLPFALAVAATGIFFWAVPYFGPSLAHGPADIVSILGLAVLISLAHRLSRKQNLIVFCVLYGCFLTYFAFLTGELPTAMGFLFPALYLATDVSERQQPAARERMQHAMAGLLAFIFGVAITVLTKQVLALATTGSSAFVDFRDHLATWMSAPKQAPGGSGYADALARLIANRANLVYGSAASATILLIASALAWIVAAVLALASRSRERLQELAVLLGGALAIPLWIAFFRNHTATHAAFMVRMLIVPIALGWAALLYQSIPRSNRPTGSVNVPAS